VKGLTTAATTWMAAAIGMASGIGAFKLAIVATVISWITLFVFHYLENIVEDLSHTEKYRLSWETSNGAVPACGEYISGHAYRLKGEKIYKKEQLIVAEWTIRASRKAHEMLVQNMLKDPRIVTLEY
jgi:putative Mg2+ transporter-C (MgtC) family protein